MGSAAAGKILSVLRRNPAVGLAWVYVLSGNGAVQWYKCFAGDTRDLVIHQGGRSWEKTKTFSHVRGRKGPAGGQKTALQFTPNLLE